MRMTLGLLVERLGLALFLGSTPVAVCAVFIAGASREWWALVNGYGFSIGMCLLYLGPFFDTQATWSARLDRATWNWIVWLTCFTEIIFQIPHQVFLWQLESVRGTILEWPLYSYGLSDNRWKAYGASQPAAVALININDAGLGVVVAILLLRAYGSRTRTNVRKSATPLSPFLVLFVVFRDATLFRETVEYMFDHARLNYPHTTSEATLRPHAIAVLWLVNICWLVVPCLTLLWALHSFHWLALSGTTDVTAARRKDH